MVGHDVPTLLVNLGAVARANEDAADARALLAAQAEAAGEKPIALEITERVLAGEHPVRVWRTHRGLTQKALACAAGTAQSYLSQIESNQRVGTLRLWKAIAVALDVDLQVLLSDDASQG